MVNAQQRMPSIKDVARQAGVSVTTVSRYLNGGPHLSEQKRLAIAKAVEELNYRPNTIARALVSSEFQSIAVIATDISLYGTMQLVQGIEQAARQRGYLVTVTLVGNGRGNVRETVDQLIRNRPIGCVILDIERSSLLHSFAGYIAKALPTVIVDETDRTQGNLPIGAYHGGYQVTQYLLRLGHKTVYHVAIPENGNTYTRSFGWRKALEEAGAVVPSPIPCSWDPREAEQIGRYLSSYLEVTAIFAGNDEIAAGVIRGLLLEGKRVPADVSVAGFDDNPIGELTVPSITTWRQDFQEIGARAVSRLADEPDGKPGDKSGVSGGRASSEGCTVDDEVPARLIIRESTAPPPSLAAAEG
ncbi:LacI family transcriptional regulator [Bifidobacterium actinocoloniiforme DSM 22766]|uniref:LacI family transcriptional regulator n=1 Tax=Bifidobacterium actinocoloniiforme DSM 22766 TaxID=1437605 RepID=A0A086YYA6_9BIFI|nr:LacI family DNA-binding transcriptional regulator [Bifidobacterium actinocoloniiforme]AKV55821.1 hypothetical protein AB656_06255 [Bifidobacterium actinocoloniiforme DSM 22766]KFI39256.1 LacI family transcriptional regulator [Bifidobacterium actinocoloniiforme DSM 22766]